MKGCPLIKSLLVRTASFTLYWLSSIPVQDAVMDLGCFQEN